MNYKKLHPNAKLEQPRQGDAGYDLYCLEGYYIKPGQLAKIKTGIALEIPMGYVGLIKDRSSMGVKGLAVRGGVIDSSYRGEIIVLLQNLSQEPHYIGAGSKIAQMIIVPHYITEISSVNELTETIRGEEGFGSTGK